MYPYNQNQVIRVNGENGAKAYQMYPNSSALLLDENAPIVYLAITDGAGYKSISAYEIKPYEPKPEVTMDVILERLNKLEEMINAKSYTAKADTEQHIRPNDAEQSAVPQVRE